MNMSYINLCSLMRPIPLYNSYLHPHVAQLPSQRSETAAQTRFHQVPYFQLFQTKYSSFVFLFICLLTNFHQRKPVFVMSTAPKPEKNTTSRELFRLLQIAVVGSVSTLGGNKAWSKFFVSSSSFPFVDHSQVSPTTAVIQFS